VIARNVAFAVSALRPLSSSVRRFVSSVSAESCSAVFATSTHDWSTSPAPGCWNTGAHVVVAVSAGRVASVTGNHPTAARVVRSRSLRSHHLPSCSTSCGGFPTASTMPFVTCAYMRLLIWVGRNTYTERMTDEATPNQAGLYAARRMAAWEHDNPDAADSIIRAYLNPETVNAELDARALEAGRVAGASLTRRPQQHLPS